MIDIVKLFEQGISISEIVDKTKLTQDEVQSALYSAGHFHYHSEPERAKHVKIAAQEYISGSESLTALSKKYQVTIKSISDFVKYLGGTVINTHNAPKFNENIFDSIDTEEKAYWLGFIFADGTISSQIKGKKSRYQFELSLSRKDCSHLEKFNQFMQYNGNNVKSDSFRCRWIINNKHLWETLNNLGCTPNKSLTLQFPKIDARFFKDFIRGYMDGDGSIGIYETKYNKRLYCQCIGTKNVLENICHICNITPSLSHDPRCAEEVLHFQLSGQKCYEYLSRIYQNATIYLDRKYQKFKEICRLWEESHKSLSSKNGED